MSRKTTVFIQNFLLSCLVVFSENFIMSPFISSFYVGTKPNAFDINMKGSGHNRSTY